VPAKHQGFVGRGGKWHWQGKKRERGVTAHGRNKVKKRVGAWKIKRFRGSGRSLPITKGKGKGETQIVGERKVKWRMSLVLEIVGPVL